MTYNFDIKPTRSLVRSFYEWLGQHIDKYMLTCEPDNRTKVFTSQTGGKKLTVKFLRKSISVETSDEKIYEYLKRRIDANYSDVPDIDRSPKARLIRAGFSLAFYALNMNAAFIGLIIEAMLFFSPISLFVIFVIYCMIFIFTFNPIYENTGERAWRTAFIQGGGIFTVLHIVFLILKAIAYAVYKNVKESYVIPNFTVEQIKRGRELYKNISELVRIQTLGYLLIVLLPFIISIVISSNRVFYTVKYTVKENHQETEKIETPQIERN